MSSVLRKEKLAWCNQTLDGQSGTLILGGNAVNGQKAGPPYMFPPSLTNDLMRSDL